MNETAQLTDDYVVPFNTKQLRRVAWLCLGAITAMPPLTIVAVIAVYKHMGITIPPTSTMIAIATKGFPGPLIIVGIEFVLIAVLNLRLLRPRKFPIIVLKPEGMALHTQMCDIDLLRWDQIESIQAYSNIYRYVGVVPKDANGLARSLRPIQRWLFNTNLRKLNKMLMRGRFFAPINIPQVHMPITADELIDHIREYQLRYHPDGPLAGDDPGAVAEQWPPKPGRARA